MLNIFLPRIGIFTRAGTGVWITKRQKQEDLQAGGRWARLRFLIFGF